jgi:hypothetical protein
MLAVSGRRRKGEPMTRICGRVLEGDARRLAILLLALLALVVTLVAPAGAAERSSCPNGFERYDVPQTETALRELPRIDAGLDAVPAPYTVAELVALGNEIDANDDGEFCLKAISNLEGQSGKAWAFFYGARDNDTGAS